MSGSETIPEPPAQGLLAKTAEGTGWVVGWRIATRLLGLISTLFLIRLLLPADFGLLALGTSLAQTVEGLAEVGIQDALLREKSRDRAIFDTAFTLNLMRSIVTSLAIVLCASPIGGFFGDSRLAEVLFTLALLTFCEGFTNIGIVDFRREFAFDKEFRLQIIPRLVGIVVAVGSAWIWQSYWALIAGLVTGRLLRVVASYVMHPYRPRLGLRAWRSLLGYSSWTWVITMVALLRDRVDSFVIGRTLNETYVGVYSIGSEVALLPSTELVFPLCRVAFSGFAEARRTEASVGQIYLRLVGAVSLLTIPAAIGVALVAEPLVRLAFGERWLAAIPVVRVLGLAGAFAAPGLMAETLLGVYGQLYRTFGARVVGLAIRLGLLLALTPLLGLLGAAIAAAIGMAVESVVLTMTALRHAGLNVRDLLVCIWRPILASAAMAALLLASGLLTGTPSAHPGLVLPSALGALVYGAALLGLWTACRHLDGAERDMLTLLASAALRLRAVARLF